MSVVVAFALFLMMFNSYDPIPTPPVGEVVMEGALGATVPPPVYNKVRSYTELQQDGIIKQSFDYSCGSAAYATLMNRYLEEELTERQVIDGLLKYGDADAIMQRKAFSMLDMKRFSAALGYKSGGFQGELSDLEELDLPCVVPIRFSGYQHFVVLKALVGGRVFLSDPFQGNLAMDAEAFERMWVDHMLFIVFPKGDKPLNVPRLTETDLRFVDPELARNVTNSVSPAYTAPESRAVFETLGTQKFLKTN